MGLDIQSDDGAAEIFRGAYSAFMKFRILMFTLVTSESYSNVHEAYLMENDNYFRPFFEKHGYGLMYLMCHSDCEGSWDLGECRAISKLLKTILNKTKDLEDGGGHIGNWYGTTEKFINGLDYCIENLVNAKFS